MAARGDSDTIIGYNYNYTGAKTYADGDVYEGEFKNDKRHGEGKYTFADGDVYEGNWKDGKRHGEGKMTYADGSVYEGNWKDGKPNRKSFAKVLVSEVFKSAGKAAASAGFAALGLDGI